MIGLAINTKISSVTVVRASSPYYVVNSKPNIMPRKFKCVARGCDSC